MDAIKSELAAQLKVTRGVNVDVKTLVSDGRTIMVELISPAPSLSQIMWWSPHGAGVTRGAIL
ncbi:hypothetical protein [Mycobacterium sp. 663a-19]|uniref:hypothetical protein n=1 Tax=Mycobacterium sp. 663a-19 TaxID=2986148 RepID=UPI002D7650B3|nr:hypothetical protein [Mycobacterium sp. 663a-19]